MRRINLSHRFEGVMSILIEQIYDEQANALKKITDPMFLILDKENYKDLINELQKTNPPDEAGYGIMGINEFIGLRVCVLTNSKTREIWVR
jgi:hypothetical protein